MNKETSTRRHMGFCRPYSPLTDGFAIFTGDSRTLITCFDISGESNSLRVQLQAVRTSTLERLWEATLLPAYGTDLRLTPGGGFLCTKSRGDLDGFRAFNVLSGDQPTWPSEVREPYAGHREEKGPFITTDDKTWAVRCNGEFLLFDPVSGFNKGRFPAEPKEFFVTFSPTGNWFVTRNNNKLLLRSVPNGEIRHCIQGWDVIFLNETRCLLEWTTPYVYDLAAGERVEDVTRDEYKAECRKRSTKKAVRATTDTATNRSPCGNLLVTFDKNHTARVLKRRRPDAWWGVLCLWELWLVAVLSAAFVWSARRDRRELSP